MTKLEDLETERAKLLIQINEEVYYEKLDNGLDVYLVPKKGFNKQYAAFSTMELLP